MRKKAGMVNGMELAEVKQAMNRKVLYRPSGSESSIPYILTGCILRRREDGGFFYQAEILDTTSRNSMIICSLNDIQGMP